MSDRELESILSRLAERMLKSGKKGLGERVVEKVEEYEIVGPETPNGIYMYNPERRKWVLVARSGDAWSPREDGIYVIYFDNTRCPACRIYDLAWYMYVGLSQRSDVHFVIVLCNWFARDCDSEAASKMFAKYNIHASPTTVLLCVRGGELVEIDRFEGAKSLQFLAKKVDEFAEKCRG